MPIDSAPKRPLSNTRTAPFGFRPAQFRQTQPFRTCSEHPWWVSSKPPSRAGKGRVGSSGCAAMRRKLRISGRWDRTLQRAAV